MGPEERLALACALVAGLLLAGGRRLRRFAVAVAVVGLAALLWPSRSCAAGCSCRHRSRSNTAPWREYFEKDTMATTPTPTPPPPPPPTPTPTPPAATPVAAEDPMPVDEEEDPRHDVSDHTEWVENPEYYGLFIAEHSGAPTYAKIARGPNLQELGRSRLGPPPGPRGRDRLSRIVPQITHSGYRDKTGQMSRFSHLQ